MTDGQSYALLCVAVAQLEAGDRCRCKGNPETRL